MSSFSILWQQHVSWGKQKALKVSGTEKKQLEEHLGTN